METIKRMSAKLSMVLLLGMTILLFGGLSYVGTQKGRLQAGEWEGLIGSKNGAQLTVFTESEEELNVGEEGILTKHFSEKLFGGTVEGWLDVARVRVVEQEPNKVIFEIVEEHSTGTINDEPIDHFKPGKRVKFTPDSATGTE